MILPKQNCCAFFIPIYMKNGIIYLYEKGKCKKEEAYVKNQYFWRIKYIRWSDRTYGCETQLCNAWTASCLYGDQPG